MPAAAAVSPSPSIRRLRLAAFMVTSAAIVLLVVACQPSHPNALAPIRLDVAGAVPADRGDRVNTDVPHDGYHFPVAPTKAEIDNRQAAKPAYLEDANRTCVTCHSAANYAAGATVADGPMPDDHATMHKGGLGAGLSCVDCHGGHADVTVPVSVARLPHADPTYRTWQRKAHVTPRLPDLWGASAANPVLPGALTHEESTDYIRFVNPGDLRAAPAACASCHNDSSEQYAVNHTRTSMMAHGAMLWEAALYNNGAVGRKNAIYAEVYDRDGNPARATTRPAPDMADLMAKGRLANLWPLPRWEVTQPGNILRVFERGARLRPDIGIPNTDEDPGRPEDKLSLRGYGTDVRTDPVFLGLQKTRLLDPTLNLFGTNDHAGDYRGSGCTACHVVYANDRSPVHSADWAAYGNAGESFSGDPTVNPPVNHVAATQPYADPFDRARRPREAGHPIKHTFVKSPPASSCIVCHVHPGTNVVNAYYGYTWWDNETDGQAMYPKRQAYPSQADEYRVSQHNPEGSAVRGLWSDPAFLAKVGTPEFNRQLKHTQFADFHGHGWVFRAVFKQDRHGNLLDHDGNAIPAQKVDADAMAESVGYQTSDQQPQPKAGVPVHLKDIHLEMGMSCVDCHFKQDGHGDGNLYGETRAAVEITCVDCHGATGSPGGIARYLLAVKDDSDNNRKGDKRTAPALLAGAFTGAAAAPDARLDGRKEAITAHFELDDSDPPRLQQIPSSGAKNRWPIVQVSDTVDPGSWWQKAAAVPDYGHPAAPADPAAAPQPPPTAEQLRAEVARHEHARLARFAHTIRADGHTWGSAPAAGDEMSLAHGNTKMSCYACHSSWNTSCFGCHLPMRANQMQPMLHNEGQVTRNYTNYNYQTLRDDVYMLGVDSTVTGHKVVPVRSACAVLVSSQDALRQQIYAQQQTVSAEGFAGTAFSPYFPHTVRGAETKQCADCHVSKANDNNAVLAQLLMQGTHAVNFIGRFAWVAQGDAGLAAVAVTEQQEPQAVIGSTLHKIAYPDFYEQHFKDHGGVLAESYEHKGTVLDVQLRGEYLYAACGENGFIAYDVANIHNKGFSERIITAPVSPMGQRLYVHTSYATSVCSPSTMAIDPTRPHRAENEEGRVHPLYAYLYVTDRDEGLVVIGNPADSPNKPGVATLLDGDPDNNFLQRAATFNPGGRLGGATSMALCGHYAYICSSSGLNVVDLNDPLHPRLLNTPGLPPLRHPKKVAFQFRYGFVIDDDGVVAIDVTDPANPRRATSEWRTDRLPLPGARDIVLCRTYAYVATGPGGLVMLNVEKPDDAGSWNPRRFTGTADHPLVDTTAVRVGMTNSSLFAYVADGVGGLKVIQLTSPDYTPGFLGFSPAPTPTLIATFPTEGPALSLSSGLDRDRAVDESGHQLAVFGRRGARPFTLAEQQELYLKTNPFGGGRSIYTVPDGPPDADPPVPAAPAAAAADAAAGKSAG